MQSRRQPRLLPRRAAAGVPGDRGGARQAPQRARLDAPHRREAVRPRSRVRAGAQQDALGAFRRDRDLPDRPLPRQGNGPEHARAAICKRRVRADLEPAVHRSCADHRRRVDRHRGTRGLLRAGRRGPRHLPEPLAAAARADGDGTSDRLQGRLGAQREGEGAEGAAHSRPEVDRARAVRARLRGGRGGPRLSRGGGRRVRLDDGDVRRSEALRRQLALGGHALLRSDGQAPGPARDDDRDPVQARAASAVRGDRVRGTAPERPPRARAAGRGRVARDRRKGSRPGDDDPHRAHGLPVRRCVPHRDAGSVRAAHPRHDARRRDTLHARGRGRGTVAPRRRDRRRMAARPAGVPELRRRDVGAAELRGAAAAGRAVVATQLRRSDTELDRARTFASPTSTARLRSCAPRRPRAARSRACGRA